MRLVLDASVVLKLVVKESDSPVAQALLGTEIAAPELVMVECANALWAKVRRRVIAPDAAHDAMDALAGLPLPLLSDAALSPSAFRLAIELDHPVYDCMYLTLALRMNGVVVTADRRFASAVAAHPTLGASVQLLGTPTTPLAAH